MDSGGIDLDSYRENLKEDERVAYTGRFGEVPVGIVFQFAEHSPDKIEQYTRIEVPESQFGDVLDPI